MTDQTAVPETVKVTTPRCVMCGETGEVEVTRDDYERWKAGAFVQVAFPEMPANRREMLITGTHPACWDEMMGDDDE